MAKKRGGLAGFYDRNKGWLNVAAPIVAGTIGGPWAGAAVGAAMRGMDRPGRRGIGFDVGEGLKGGVAGYGMGKLGQAGRKGVASLFTAKASPGAALLESGTQAMNQGLGMIPEVAAPSVTSPAASLLAPAGASMPSLPAFNMGQIGITPNVPTGPVASSTIPAQAKAATTNLLKDIVTDTSKKKGRVSQLLTGVRENWEPIAGIAKGIGTTMGGQAQESLANEKIALERMRFEEERAQLQRERESRQRLTQLLMPLLQAQMTNVLPPNAPAPR